MWTEEHNVVVTTFPATRVAPFFTLVEYCPIFSLLCHFTSTLQSNALESLNQLNRYLMSFLLEPIPG